MNPPQAGSLARTDIWAWLTARWGAARFIVIFSVLAGVLLALYYYPYPEGSRARAWLDAYLAGYAAASGAVLRVFEPNVRVVGQNITGRFAMRIIKTCDAMDVLILLLSAIAAWPAPWRKRAASAGLGIALISGLNIARICTIYYVGVYAPASVDFVHLELWPAIILVAAVGAFLGFIFWVGDGSQRGARGAGGT